MPRNGSGTYERVHNWTNDANAGIPIEADRMDAEDDSIATALTNSLAKDGQTVPTGNLPMGGFKHTDVANGSARDDYAALGQLQDNGVIYVTATGSSNAYALAPSPAITAYANGQRFMMVANHTNTGAATLNVSALGAEDLVRPDTTAVKAGDIVSGQVYDVVRVGGEWILMNPFIALDSGSFTITLTGFTTTTSGTMKYTRVGGRVTLYLDAQISGTSSSSAMTSDAIPAAIRPASARSALSGRALDNSIDVETIVFINSDGTLVFSRAVVSGTAINYNSSGWTNSGTKGLSNAFLISYEIG